MEIKQFYDDNLAHASYAILSKGEVALVDPSRDPKPYYDFAKNNNAKITTVIETHPHADFVSSHLEVSNTTGAKVYTSKLYGPKYEYTPFDDGEQIKLGEVTLESINTPGHSPDSISILIKDKDGNDYAVATGDTLFVGDVGRPDLRETAGAISLSREDLARMMYNTIHEKLFNLSDDTIVYPAHGAGSLCGKSLSDERTSTIGKEKTQNYAFQPMSEDKFVDVLLEDQPFIPKYFTYDVELNRDGAPNFEESVSAVPGLSSASGIEEGAIVIDSRLANEYRAGHYKGSINIPGGKSFETWVGSIVGPGEEFYLIGKSDEDIDSLVRRIAKIGYESKITGTITADALDNSEIADEFDFGKFKESPDDYFILDVRNPSEVKAGKVFENSLNIPLADLRDRIGEIKTDKPIVAHCAGGSRSSTAASIIKGKLGIPAVDLAARVKEFHK